jgi:hypothetical protein
MRILCGEDAILSGERASWVDNEGERWYGHVVDRRGDTYLVSAGYHGVIPVLPRDLTVERG